MGVQIKKTLLIQLIIFLFIIGLTILLFVPVQNLIENRLTLLKKDAIAFIESALGREVRYGEIAPSFFRSIKIKNLEIYDKDNTDTPLVAIRQVRIRYNLFQFLRGNPIDAVRQIRIENSSISVNEENDADIIRLIEDIINNRNAVAFPNIQFIGKNLSFSYQSEKMHIKMERIFAKFARNNEDTFNVQVRGNITGNFEETMAGIRNLETSIHIFGTTDFRSADARLRINELHTDVLSVVEQNFRFSLYEKEFRVQKIQDREPIDIAGLIDLEQKRAEVTILMEDFYPADYGIIHVNLPAIQPWFSTRISGTLEGIYYFEDNDLEYAVNIEAYAENEILPFPVYAEIDAEGNLNNLQADRILLKSHRGAVVYSGSLNFENFMPSGVFRIIDLAATEYHTINGTMYLQPFGNILQIRSNNLMVGKTNFTDFIAAISLQENEYEIRLKAGLGPHTQMQQNGRITFEGNLTTLEGNYFQGALRLIECNAGELAYLLPETVQEPNFMKQLDDFSVNTEVFFTTDFSQYAYVFPFLTIASNVEERKKISISIAGNSETIEVTGIEGSWNEIYATGNFTLDFSSEKEIDFSSRMKVNGFDYAFDGKFVKGTGLRVEGSYNTKIIVLFQEREYLFHLFTEAIPFQYKSVRGDVNLEIFGLFRDFQDWKTYVSNVEVANGEVGANYRFSTKAKAVIDQNSVSIHNIEFKDPYSSLTGRGKAGINNLETFDMSGWVTLSDENGEELYTLSGKILNKKINAAIVLKSSPIKRMQIEQLAGDVSGSVSISGPLSSPQFVLGFETKNATLNNDKIGIAGEVKSTKEEMKINALEMTYLSNSLILENSRINLTRGTFFLEGDFSGIFQGKKLRSGIRILGDTKKRGPRKKLSSILRGDLEGDFIFAPILYQGRNLETWELSFEKKGQLFTIKREPNDDVHVKIKSDGFFEIKMTEPLPFQLYASGTIKENKIDARVTNIDLDIEALNTIMHIPYFDIKKGTGKGNLNISGSFTDPDFSGKLQIIDGIAENPLIPVDLGPFHVDLLFSGKNFTVPLFYINADEATVAAELDFIIDHWIPKYYTIDLESVGTEGIPMVSNFSRIYVDGEALVDVVLSGDFSGIDISGKLIPQNMRLTLGDAPESTKDSKFEFNVDLEIETGRQIEFLWPATTFPILQTYAQIDETVNISYNSLIKSYQVVGDVSTRGGQIFYFNRNFILKEASISFNEEQGRFDPYLTARAELREITNEGESVTVIMIVDRKPFSQFSPRFESDPPLPNNEVLALLGQNIITQMGGEEISLGATLALTGNIFLKQLGLMASIENTIRDILRLDLFSIRSQMLENLLSDRFFAAENLEASEEVISLGRYLDNTTLFLGKYLSEDIFLEAMLGLRLKQTEEELLYSDEEFEIDTEISVEWKTPLALLEFSFMPDVTDLFGAPPAVSLALSWGFSF